MRYDATAMERSADWMYQAEGDLAHVRHDLAGSFYDWACFSAQQSSEKALKAVFAKLGAEAWGHALDELVAELAPHFSAPDDVVQAARELDKVYIPTRYPNAHPGGSPRSLYTRIEAERCLAHAERIVAFCQGLLAAL